MLLGVEAMCQLAVLYPVEVVETAVRRHPE